MTITEPSLQAPILLTDPGTEYSFAARQWQGIPGIERAANGRLWATWYSGGAGEGSGNYVVLATSADDGRSWSDPVLIVAPPDPAVRDFDPVLWHDPRGRLWFCWAQSEHLFDGRCGVWATCCENSGDAQPDWTAPRRLCHGIMMNKPTVLSTGEWLLPAAIWAHRTINMPEMARERFPNVICSTDEGETWSLRGSVDMPERQCDEHMIVERRDGTLWMLVRTRLGIGESVSADRGVTWIGTRPLAIPGPVSRFFIRRLRSGRLLLVNHHHFTGRNNLTAMLSDDDGQSWYGHLLLDARDNVSYPDGVETADGIIYLIYDRDRYGVKEILLAVFTEEDVRRGQCVSDVAHLQVKISGI